MIFNFKSILKFFSFYLFYNFLDKMPYTEIKPTINPAVCAEETVVKEKPQTSRVLIMTVMNSLYPLTAEIFHAICRPSGGVLRIVLVRRRGVQALVEFDCQLSAMRAKASLNGTDIYSCCCTLKIEYAKNSPLIVFRNDSDTWDFTKEYDEVTGTLKPKANFQQSVLYKINQSISPDMVIGNEPTPEESTLMSMADLQHGHLDPETGNPRRRKPVQDPNSKKNSFGFEKPYTHYDNYIEQYRDYGNKERQKDPTRLTFRDYDHMKATNGPEYLDTIAQ